MSPRLKDQSAMALATRKGRVPPGRGSSKCERGGSLASCGVLEIRSMGEGPRGHTEQGLMGKGR